MYINILRENPPKAIAFGVLLITKINLNIQKLTMLNY